MNRFPFIAGTVMLLLAAGGAQAKPLYDTIKENIEREIVTAEPEESIVKYLHAIYEDEWELTEDDVKNILKGDAVAVCGEKLSGDDGKNLIDCQEMTDNLIQSANQEGRIREMARTIQAIATSYELPLSEIPGHPIKFSTDLRGIVNIWSTEGTLSGLGNSSSSTASSAASSANEDGPPVFLPDNPIYPRTQPLTLLTDAERTLFQEKLNDLRAALDDLSDEEKTAAVWRYMYGVRLVRNDRSPDYPPPFEDAQSGAGTERQYLFKRWEAVEQALMAMWDWDEKFPKNPASYDPPLKKNDVVYFLFPEPLDEDLILWLRVDGDPSVHPMGDAGLHFKMPLEPVLPSLNNGDEPILGGIYPPEPMIQGRSAAERNPVDGRRLCSAPAAQRGYLCRPFAALEEENRCPPLGQTHASGQPVDPTAIHLTSCILGNTGATLAGADVCREIPWRESTFDPLTNCAVGFVCSANCGNDEELRSFTESKDPAGNIEVCIENDLAGVPATYVAYKELMHAYQFCSGPPQQNRYQNMDVTQASAACCRMEGEAFRAMCDLLEQDGVIGPTVAIDGIAVTPENCAEALTDRSCKGQSIGDQRGAELPLNGCPVSRVFTPGFADGIEDLMRTNPADVQDSCNDVANNPDLRIATMLRTLEVHDAVCTISSLTEYKNRIGNELCFIGQCMEESLELHRLTPGRSPAGAGDQAFPWDYPLAGSPPLGNLLTSSPIGQGYLPQYRPQLLAQEFETALCQLQGLPARTPPILCAINTDRRLALPLKDFFPTVSSLVQQNAEGESVNTDLLSLSMGVGARMGTNLYTSYLRVTSRSLAETLTTAKDLLTDIKDIDFPSQMCPTGPSPLLAPGT